MGISLSRQLPVYPQSSFEWRGAGPDKLAVVQLPQQLSSEKQVVSIVRL